ncbi:MAG TPA: ferritin-like domain-containing protein [Terriglobales bacterium]|jgi:bacterioferritin
MNSPKEQKGPFVADIEAIRQRARQHIEDGAVTDAYRGDRETVIKVLNEALATELVCVLRYKRHYFTATGIHAQAVAAEFLEHAQEEQDHADKIAERITQLDGYPDFNPATLASRSHSEYVEGTSLADMIREDLIAERIAIESYNEIIRYLGDNDPTSRRVMEEILAKEEEHAEDMRNLIQTVTQAEEADKNRSKKSGHAK